MTAYTQTLRISDVQYQQLSLQAHAAHKTVEEYAEKVFAQILSLPVKSPEEQRQHDLQQLELLDDAALWQIFDAEFPEDKWEVYETLLDANTKRQLTAVEQQQLSMLRSDADLMMLRRAYSARLLHERGHEIPDPYDVTEDE